MSYAFLIVTALLVVAIVLILFLLRNPFLYRQALDRLNAVQNELTGPPGQVTQTQAADRLQSIATDFNVRVLVFDSNGALVQDTGAGSAAISLPVRPLIQRVVPTLRDYSDRVWLYTLRRLPDGGWLMVATPRPKVIPALAILTDDLSAPLLEAGLIALLLSLVVAFVIARWVADPLGQVIAAARTFPSDAMRPVEVRGPHEVQELARAFNAMVHRVQSGQRSQRDFVANVSHELKTPLTSIQGFAQALMDGTAESPDARHQAAEVIFNEAGRMHRMALDLLDLARLDAGTADLKMSTVDTLSLLNSINEKFKPLAAERGVALKFSLAHNLPVITGDGDRLAQVFTNLVENALKFAPGEGMVAVRAIQDRDEVQVAVSDTGKGIPREAIPHIFDRFYQADGARAGGDGHGAGLGLAIAHEIVLAHGGRISVRSTQGRGTAFIVHLPVAPRQTSA